MSSFAKDMPKTWEMATLGDAYQVIGGGTPSTEMPDYWGGSIPWITSADIEGVFQINIRKYVTEKGIAASTTNKVPAKTILVVTRVGLGKIAIAETPICFSQDLQGLIQNPELICPEYTLYLLSYELQFLKFDGRGTTISGVTKKQLKDLGFPLPPIKEQHRIVAKIEELFSELDKGVEYLKTAQAQLKVYRQALLKHAFEGKLTAQWRKQHRTKQSVAPAKAGAQPLNDMDSRPTPSRGLALRGNDEPLEAAADLLKCIQQERAQRYQQQLADWEASGKQGSKPKPPKTLPPLSAEELAELPELPEGWGWVKSGELFESVTSGSRGWAQYYADSGAIFIRITNLDFDSLKLDLSPKKIQYVQPPVGAEGLRTKVKEGDFLFSITGYLGMFAIAPSIGDAYVNQHISLARPLDGFSKKYFGYYVTSHTGGIHYLNKQTKGAVKAGLGLDDIQNFPVPICSLNEQIEISSELESRLSEADQLDQTITTSLQQAEVLRQSILKKAFSGRLVPQDPNDEPASELLARIKAERLASQGSLTARRKGSES